MFDWVPATTMVRMGYTEKTEKSKINRIQERNVKWLRNFFN